MNKEDREELREMLELVLKPIVDQQREHHRTLFGNGSEENQGLRVEVDRLKQDHARRKEDGRVTGAHKWAIYMTLLAIILKDLWAWIRSLGAPHVNP